MKSGSSNLDERPQQVTTFGTVVLRNAQLGEHGGAACDDAMHAHEAIQVVVPANRFSEPRGQPL